MKTIEMLFIRLQEVSNDTNLKLDHNSTYGGYRIEKVNPATGATRGAFGENGCEPRLSNKEMCIKIIALINGIEFGRNNPK